jgi:hypothetical protein
MTLLSSSLSFRLAMAGQGTAVMGQNPQWAAEIELMQALQVGTTVGKADLGYLAQRQVASATDDDIDLAGVLTDAFGATITAAELVALLVFNRPRLDTDTVNTTDLTIGGGSNPFLGFLSGTTPKIGPIKPGGFLLLASPHASGLGTITAATADILRIANSAGAINNYVLGLLARTA